jgi:hypothetical protein
VLSARGVSARRRAVSARELTMRTARDGSRSPDKRVSGSCSAWCGERVEGSATVRAILGNPDISRTRSTVITHTHKRLKEAPCE